MDTQFCFTVLTVVLSCISIALVIQIAMVSIFVYRTKEQITVVAKQASKDYVESEEGRTTLREIYSEISQSKEKGEG